MTYTPPFPQSTDDTIDSRDVIFHIEDLESDLADARDEEDTLAVADILLQLKPLQELAEEGETLEDWEHGVQLIRDSYFETFAQEFADDIGAINESQSGGNWPLYCIDWEQAARELQQDYTPIEYEGVTYWAR